MVAMLLAVMIKVVVWMIVMWLAVIAAILFKWPMHFLARKVILFDKE